MDQLRTCRGIPVPVTGALDAPGACAEPLSYIRISDRLLTVAAADGLGGHAFISYVREDSHEVERLQRTLESAGIRVWRDTTDLWPGEDWRARIREAITSNALVFIACFSRHSVTRKTSYQNQELALAVDQLMLRQPGVPWLIPIRFDDCSIPDLDIGGGRTLRSIQQADLFGEGYDQAAARLVRIVQHLLGSPYGAFRATSVPSPIAANPRKEPTDVTLLPGDQDASEPTHNSIPLVDPRWFSHSLDRSPESTALQSASANSDTQELSAAVTDQPGTRIICPMCLSSLDWPQLSLWRWDERLEEYIPLEIPEEADRRKRAQMEREAMVGCPDPGQVFGEMHFLPYEYGRHGKPVILAFVGDAGSGKSSLLATMISGIEHAGLSVFGIDVRPVDIAMHRRSIEMYSSMHRWRRVFPSTLGGGVTFTDAFLMRPPNCPRRTVALFDVGGNGPGGLAKTAAFLGIADGLIFVVDSQNFWPQLASGHTFDRVLSLLKASGVLPHANVALVFTKADTLPPDHPLAQWLTRPVLLDPEMIFRESSEIMAYLENESGSVWSQPYRECGKVTLHVVSALGSPDAVVAEGHYRSGPQRVLSPLVTMLAMTSVLHDESAKRIGCSE